jgi:hypothetical protein
VFMNGTVQEYCRKAGVEFTRRRPYRKSDQAWVERKNGSIVRRLVGYRRVEGLEAAAVLAQSLCASEVVCELLPTLFQVGGEDARRRAGAEALPPASDTVPAIAGRPGDPLSVRDRVTVLKAGLPGSSAG